MPKVRVLIADNSKDFVWFLVEYLSKNPQIEIVGIAYDGKQTLKIIEETKPDILLLDLIMPDMDGLEVLKKIRKMYVSLNIFVLSALTDKNIIEMVMKLGATRYFEKPFDLSDIIPVILGKY